MSYVNELPTDVPYQIYFDNLFATVNLLAKEKSIEASGTTQQNYLDKNCPLKSDKELKKEKKKLLDYS